MLTAIRVPLAVAFLVFPDITVRLAIVVMAAASDLGDGMWARRIGGSRVGAVLDPVADKLFMAAAFVVVLTSGRLHPLEILAVLSRDIVAFIALLIAALVGRATPLPARAGGKAVTVVQLLTLVAFLAQSDLLRPLAWATGAVSVYAIADYMRVGFRPGPEE
ncbi:MAG TPA: CDP-alcohol phosphatidyltransferase family protein [Gemmatimonadales bacterium]